MKADTILGPRRPHCRDQKRNAANGFGFPGRADCRRAGYFLLMFALRRRRKGQPHIPSVSAMLGRKLYLLTGDRL